MNVTAVLVTRGDVDMQPVLDSLPAEWPVVIWDNSSRRDVSVFGRYQALYDVTTPLVYCQDDDVIVSDPEAIVDAWRFEHVVCNMPPEFRPHYPDSALVGFGSCFRPKDALVAFRRFRACRERGVRTNLHRTCDVVFTTLTPRILVDVPKTDREFASDPGRMWTTPGHVEERTRMLELARRVREA